jgi:hypothetical protein
MFSPSFWVVAKHMLSMIMQCIHPPNNIVWRQPRLCRLRQLWFLKQKAAWLKMWRSIHVDSQSIMIAHCGLNVRKPTNKIVYLRLATGDDEEWSVPSWGPTLFQSPWLPSVSQLPRPEAMKQAATIDIEKHLKVLEKARSDLEAS